MGKGAKCILFTSDIITVDVVKLCPLMHCHIPLRASPLDIDGAN